MKSQFFKEQSEESTDLNMTPLLDVLFVLLILFILVAPLLKIDRIQLVSSIEEAKTVKTANFQTKSPLVIEVDQHNEIFVNQKKIILNELASCIRSLSLPQGTIPILLQDKKSEFGVFETIKQTLEAQDFKQLDIILN
ncbi:MAG: biopolymer transporter ExbD [Chlamydiae bacterium]|jgi:biopolymer transport protein ExbD|nr:biopolymer transporter ExbD [Chlamydiota bacterium]